MATKILPTVRVARLVDGLEMVINASDFDATAHRLCSVAQAAAVGDDTVSSAIVAPEPSGDVEQGATRRRGGKKVGKR